MPTSKRFTAPFIVMFGVLIAMVAFAVPASAAPYTNQTTTSVSTQNPVAGASLTFAGSGFQAGETVTITLSNGTKYPSVVADASGAFSTTVVLPAGLSGTQTLTATGLTSGRTSSTVLHIAVVTSANSGIPAAGTTGGTTSTGSLAFTGSNAIGVGVLGALLLAGGAAMAFAGKRRRAVVA